MAGWTFITNHGAVLALIHQDGKITAREAAARLGITERSVLRIVRDLIEAGYLHKAREGRGNRYTINRDPASRRGEGREAMVLGLAQALDIPPP